MNDDSNLVSISKSSPPAVDPFPDPYEPVSPRLLASRCPRCGRSGRRHAAHYYPSTDRFIGWQSCESVARADAAMGRTLGIPLPPMETDELPLSHRIILRIFQWKR